MASRLARRLALGLVPRASLAPPQHTPQLIRGAYLWQSGLEIDADGGRHAYAPPGSGLVGLDYLANAGSPGHYYGLACNTSGSPFVQSNTDPAPGFYISVTAYVDHTKAANDPTRYVDSETVPYLVVPPDLTGQRGVRMGDFGMVIYNGIRCPVVIADVGPRGHFGEGSIALAQMLGIPSSPKNGGAARGVTCVVFPGTAKPWPRSDDEIKQGAAQAFDAWGDEGKVPWLAAA